MSAEVQESGGKRGKSKQKKMTEKHSVLWSIKEKQKRS